MITAECVNCSACEWECPVRAISAHADQYVVDNILCVDCEGYFDEPRCKWACPVNACVPERETYLHNAAVARRGGGPVVYKGGSMTAGQFVSKEN